MEIEITVDMLTKDSVSIKTQKYYIDGENRETIGLPHRRGYINNATDRETILELGEPYISSIFAIWGNEPTIIEDEMEEINSESN